MPLQSLPPNATVSVGKALRHLILFQIKLMADALRDFLLSPISMLAFLLDVILKPQAANSNLLKLMYIGRQSDRMINLFWEYSDKNNFTIDTTVAGMESVLQNEIQELKKRREKSESPGDDC